MYRKLRSKLGSKLFAFAAWVSPNKNDRYKRSGIGTTSNKGVNTMLDSLKPFSKAVAATLAGAFVTYLTKHNVVIADGLADSLEVVISALFTGAIVYFAPRNRNV